MSHRSKEKARNKLLQNGREECSTPPGVRFINNRYKFSNPDDGLLNVKLRQTHSFVWLALWLCGKMSRIRNVMPLLLHTRVVNIKFLLTV